MKFMYNLLFLLIRKQNFLLKICDIQIFSFIIIIIIYLNIYIKKNIIIKSSK